MFKRILFILFFPALIIAQNETQNEAEAFLDELFAVDSLEVIAFINDLKKQDYLYTTLIYNNKTLFSGRDFGVDQYSTFPSISYINSSNFFLNAGTGYYSGVTPHWDFVSLSGGYTTYLTKKKTLSATGIYSYSFYSDDTANLNKHRISGSIGLCLGGFRNSISSGYLFGGIATFYMSNNSYYNIDLLKSEKLTISTQPRLGLFWGSQTVTELIRTGVFNFTTISTDVFQQLNTEFSIPVEFSFGVWDIEVYYTFSFPNALPNEESLDQTGYFSVSLGYLIGL